MSFESTCIEDLAIIAKNDIVPHTAGQDVGTEATEKGLITCSSRNAIVTSQAHICTRDPLEDQTFGRGMTDNNPMVSKQQIPTHARGQAISGSATEGDIIAITDSDEVGIPQLWVDSLHLYYLSGGQDSVGAGGLVDAAIITEDDVVASITINTVLATSQVITGNRIVGRIRIIHHQQYLFGKVQPNGRIQVETAIAIDVINAALTVYFVRP